MWDLERRQRRVERSRAIARAEIGIAVAWVVLTFFALSAMPGHMGGGPTPADFVPGVVATQVVCIVWMIRVYRANPEPAQPTWRYRDF
jgi:hypothetical protein